MEKHLKKLIKIQHLLLKSSIKRANSKFWEQKIVANKWSAQEHLAHLASYQHIFYNRILRIIETDNPHFEKYEAEEDANFSIFKNLDLEDLWKDLKIVRKKLLNLVESLSKKQVARTATHTRYGTLNIENWLNFFILHESHHIFAIFQLEKQFEKKDDNLSINNEEDINLIENSATHHQKHELLQVYDSNHQATNQFLPRSEVHKKGLWHKTMHCWIIYRNKRGENRDYIVFQRRSEWKDSDPNKFDTTAAGHYTADLPIESQRFREVEEELGLEITEKDEKEMIFAGVRVNVEDFQEEFFNHEFQDVYFWVNNTPLKNYKLQTEEVSGLVALEISEGLKLFTGEVEQISAKGIEVVYAKDGTTSYKNKTFNLKKDDFGQTLDNYFAKALILGQRILAGEKYVMI